MWRSNGSRKIVSELCGRNYSSTSNSENVRLYHFMGSWMNTICNSGNNHQIKTAFILEYWSIGYERRKAVSAICLSVHNLLFKKSFLIFPAVRTLKNLILMVFTTYYKEEGSLKVLLLPLSVKLFHGQKWILYVICRYKGVLNYFEPSIVRELKS